MLRNWSKKSLLRKRFFCCIGCKNNYKAKYAGKVQSIVEQYKEMQKEGEIANSFISSPLSLSLRC
jgi:hypothetical protein